MLVKGANGNNIGHHSPVDTLIGCKTIDQLFEPTFYGLGIIQTGRPYLSRKIETLQRFEQNNAMMERTNHIVK